MRKSLSAAQTNRREGCIMKDIPLTGPQQQAAQKMFAWLDCTKDAVDDGTGREEAQPDGTALSPHERGCGRAYPIRGTNHEDLAEWCMRHES